MYRDGEARVNGMLTDHAYYIWGLLELFQATFEYRYLDRALDYTRRTIDLFSDEGGGFFNSVAKDDLVLLSKEISDRGNAVGELGHGIRPSFVVNDGR